MTEAPLEEFNAEVVQAPLQGLLRNMDEELARRVKQATITGNREVERQLSLLLIMLRLTRNSYEAACFLISTKEENPKRKKEFALVLPPTNRQLLDLLFTILFMTDDFQTRSAAYDRSGYREARENYDRFYQRFGTDEKWQGYFRNQQQTLKLAESYSSITPDQKADPTLIPYWQSPYKMMKRRTKSQSFMRFLNTWLYGEISAQAHLHPAALFSVASFVIADLMPENERDTIMGRKFEQYKFQHFTRTLITVLAIATEIDVLCLLNNKEVLSRVWVLLAGYASEADDIYKERYQSMLNLPG